MFKNRSPTVASQQAIRLLYIVYLILDTIRHLGPYNWWELIYKIIVKPCKLWNELPSATRGMNVVGLVSIPGMMCDLPTKHLRWGIWGDVDEQHVWYKYVFSGTKCLVMKKMMLWFLLFLSKVDSWGNLKVLVWFCWMNANACTDFQFCPVNQGQDRS